MDEEYDAAMVGYLEARKKFLQLRRSRGFTDPDSSTAGRKTDQKPKHPRRGDLQWRSPATSSSGRPGHPTSSTSRSTSSAPTSRTSGPGRGRGKGGSGRRSKGQGRRTKGSGKRNSSQRRGDPNGAQYLGWASETAEAVPSRVQPQHAMMAEFQPEFSFMAAVSSRHSGCAPEEAERCLLWDQQFGLDSASSTSEHACLAVPPGHAIVDTGCTSTLVGAESERLWNEELSRQSGGFLQAERGPSDVKFEGINGEARATYQVKYPVRIGGKDGFVKASVIPGRAPFLLSIQALRQMRAKLDCERDFLEIPKIGCVQLSVNAVGHYLLPMFDFQERPRLPPGLEHGMSAAKAECPGPEDESEGKASGSVSGSRVKYPQVFRPTDVGVKECPTHPPAQEQTLTYQPQSAELSKRSDKLARSVLLRLS